MEANSDWTWSCTCPSYRRDEDLMPQFFLPGESQSCKHILGVQQGTAEILEGEPYSAKAKAKKRVWLVQGSGTNKYTVTHEPEEEEEPHVRRRKRRSRR